MDILGYLGVIGIQGYTEAYMGTQENTRVYIGMLGFTWVYYVGYTWVFIGIQG